MRNISGGIVYSFDLSLTLRFAISRPHDINGPHNRELALKLVIILDDEGLIDRKGIGDYWH